MISIRDLRKKFDKQKDVYAINGINVTIPQGSFFTLLGPSGCGKSTTLRCLAGLERPQDGEIAIEGRTVFSSEKRIFISPNRRNISMVFQSYAIWPHMTVFGNVAYPLKIRRVKKQEIHEKVNAALKMVGLDGFADRPASKLSGGQQQRVALARAIVAEPQALLLDEPLSNLDAKLRVQMSAELLRLQSKLGSTVVYVTHDQQEALAMSDQIAVMNKGRIVQLGTPKEIYNKPKKRFTAEFIGRTNIIHGTVGDGLTAGIHAIETELGVLRACVDEGTVIEGSKICISVRPESIEFIESDASGDRTNILEGYVERAVFHGDRIEYEINVKGKTLVVNTKPAAKDFGIGTKVALSIPPESAVVIEDEME